jgi:hypothetical protein
MFMSSCGFENLRSVATGLSPGVSHSGMDQGVSRFTAGTVRGGHRMPVIVKSHLTLDGHVLVVDLTCQPRLLARTIIGIR